MARNKVAGHAKRDHEVAQAEEEKPSLTGVAGSQAIATIAQGSAPANIGDYDAEDMGEGFEGMTSEDFVTPYLVVLQAKSPQLNKQKAEYVPGAEAGMFMDSVTHEIYDGNAGVVIIPLHREKFEVEWVPRDSGGGLVAKHDPEDPDIAAIRAKQPMGKIEGFGDGNDLVTTYYLYALLLTKAGIWSPVVVTFASTQIAAYRNLVTLARNQVIMVEGRQVPLPLFAHAYRLTTKYKEKNGFDWFALYVGFAGEDALSSRINKNDAQYQEAKKSRKLVTSGAMKIADASINQDAATGESGDGLAADEM